LWQVITFFNYTYEVRPVLQQISNRPGRGKHGGGIRSLQE